MAIMPIAKAWIKELAPNIQWIGAINTTLPYKNKYKSGTGGWRMPPP